MTPRVRPKHVDRGTSRHAFQWEDVGEPGPTMRYCTVTWIRHGAQLAAVATYRNVGGLDIQYLGMAQGSIDGPLHAAGDPAAFSVRELLRRAPKLERDGIEACVILAIQSLERAVSAAAYGGADDHNHPWKMAGQADLAAHRNAKRKARREAEA